MKHQKILSKDIYDYVATHSSLTRKQAQECFNAYSQLIKELSSSEYFENDAEIVLPNIGSFYFKKMAGRKKGSRIVYPDLVEKGKVNVKVLEKDDPTTWKLDFKVYKLIKDNSKRLEDWEMLMTLGMMNYVI